MILSMIVEVFIKAFLLFLLLYIVARDEADFDFRKVTMVTAGIVLGGVLLEGLLTRHIGLWTLVPLAALIVFLVMQFCWVRFWRAMLVAIPFLILNIMISTSVSSFNEKANQAVARGLQGPVTDEDMKEAMLFFKQSVGDPNMQLPFEKKEIKVEPTLEQIILKSFLVMLSSAKFPSKTVSGGKIAAPAPAAVKKELAAPPLVEDQDVEKSDADWPAAEKKLAVAGLLIGKDGVRVAVVNNQMIKEGDCIQVRHEKITYRWRAVAITGRTVSWERVEAHSK